MEISVKRIVLQLCLILSISISGCTGGKEQQVPYYNDASFTPCWTKPDSMHTIGNFSFTDQFGKTFSQSDVKGKIYLSNFFFTSCTSICPDMASNIREVYKEFKGNKKVLFLSHSVTPQIDSVARLKKYADENNIDGRQWHLLTGNQESIYNLARKSYFIEEKAGLSKSGKEFLHTENFVLVDQEGHIRGLYNGTLKTEVARIVDDINYLLR